MGRSCHTYYAVLLLLSAGLFTAILFVHLLLQLKDAEQMRETRKRSRQGDPEEEDTQTWKPEVTPRGESSAQSTARD